MLLYTYPGLVGDTTKVYKDNVQLSSARVLLIGVGGLGCPAAMAMVAGGLKHLRLVDDDVVEKHNLHRQILFQAADVGRAKVEAAAQHLRHLGAADVQVARLRFLPENALSLLEDIDLVVEGCDNVPTKFLTADACALAGVPVIHAGAVGWHGTSMAVAAQGAPCFRCIFEDIPSVEAPNCAEVGVMGPAVGQVAALQADLALRALSGLAPWGMFRTADARKGSWREHRVAARVDCPLCGDSRRRPTLQRQNYLGEQHS